MKTLIISAVLIIVFIFVNIWVLSNNEMTISKEEYVNFIKEKETANETVKRIETFLLELPRIKTRKDLDFYEFYEEHKNDTLMELIDIEYNGKFPSQEIRRIENLRIYINENGEIDTIKVADFYSEDSARTVMLPILSNFEKDLSENYSNSYIYDGTHLFWQFLVGIFALLIILTSIYYKIKKQKIIQNSLIIYLISVILLNIIHFGFYQKILFYREAADVMSFGMMNNFSVMSLYHNFNFFAFGTHKYATVFDITLVIIIILSIVLTIRLRNTEV